MKTLMMPLATGPTHENDIIFIGNSRSSRYLVLGR